MMKKRIILLLLLPALLISGCISESVENSDADKDEVCISWPPSQFVSEEELVKTIKAFKDNPKQMVKTELIGEISNRDELDKRDFYYMPVIVPNEYKLKIISVVPDIFWSAYFKNGDENDFEKALTFEYYTAEGWTMESAIKENKLVKSKYSEEIYFNFNKVQQRYNSASFEFDNIVFTMRFPYEISLDDEEQIKMIEEICQMEKKMIE